MVMSHTLKVHVKPCPYKCGFLRGIFLECEIIHLPPSTHTLERKIATCG